MSSRAERRRRLRAARENAQRVSAREARQVIERRKLIRNQGEPDRSPLLWRLVKGIGSTIHAMEMREFWIFAGLLGWIGRGMGIDTRDPRMPAWTGLKRDPSDEAADSRKPRPSNQG